MTRQRVYEVQYALDGAVFTQSVNVTVTDGYTSFADIPRIIAVSHYSSNEPDEVAKVEILRAVLIQTEEVQ